MSSLFSQASLVVEPAVYESGKVYATKPFDGSGDLTFSRASTATRVNASGLIESVSSGVPRLDYTNSTCPKLLLEPSRTNVIIQSQDQSSASYAAVINEIASRVAVANPLTGQNNAYKITTTSGGDPYIGQQVFGLANGQNTFSLWLWTDAGQSTEATLFFYNAAVSEVNQQSVTLTTTPTRYVFTVNFTSVGAHAFVRLDLRQTGPATQYLYTYGWQAEVGAYATSLIPTTSAAVTRLAESLSLSNLQNTDMTFTAFLELDEPSIGTTASDWFSIGNASSLGRAYGYANGFGFADAYNLDSASARKMLWKQESGSTAKVFKDGTLAGTSTSGAYSAPFSIFEINGAFLAKPIRIKQFLFFANNITDAQCIELTTL